MAKRYWVLAGCLFVVTVISVAHGALTDNGLWSGLFLFSIIGVLTTLTLGGEN